MWGFLSAEGAEVMWDKIRLILKDFVGSVTAGIICYQVFYISQNRG